MEGLVPSPPARPYVSLRGIECLEQLTRGSDSRAAGHMAAGLPYARQEHGLLIAATAVVRQA